MWPSLRTCLSKQMTPRGLRKIQTRNSCRDALLYANMTPKPLQYFYLLIEKPLGRFFQVWSPYYLVAQCNQKTLIFVSSRWQVGSEKAKKGGTSILITATASVHVPQPVSSWSNNKVRFSFNQPIRKRWGAKLVYVVKYLLQKVF